MIFISILIIVVSVVIASIARSKYTYREIRYSIVTLPTLSVIVISVIVALCISPAEIKENQLAANNLTIIDIARLPMPWLKAFWSIIHVALNVMTALMPIVAAREYLRANHTYGYEEAISLVKTKLGLSKD